MPAALTDGGEFGVAAVCRRPVKDPPRQLGERAFTGLSLGAGRQLVLAADARTNYSETRRFSALDLL